MDSLRWEKTQELFHAALPLDKEERAQFLKANCAADPALRDAVLAMLNADADGSPLLASSVPEIAAEILSEFATGADIQPSMELGPYRLKHLLGEGGMGVVWLAERVDAGNLVAIKFLPSARLSPARRNRFAQEIRLLARLNHPNIARLYDAGTLSDTTPWFVMEYVEGTLFTDYCRLKPIREQLLLFRSVCEAVKYAHSQEIIHRDLKPSNILVLADGTTKLLDFGIARELQQLDEKSSLTQHGPRFMSPRYSAPEWRHHGIVGFSTDVYSLGVILYELLAGQLPRENKTGDVDAIAHVTSAPHADRPSLAARRRMEAGNISREDWNDLDVLCLKAIHRDAAVRYSSVEAMVRDIDHFLRSEPLEARPESLRYRSSKFVRRNLGAVLATAAILLVVAGMTTFFTVRLAKERNAALAEAARTQRIQRFMLNLLGDGDREAAPSGELRVTTLLDRGAAEADTLSADPVTQSELYESLGTMYDKLGKFQKANDLLSMALNKTKSALGPEDPKVAALLVEMGTLQGDEAKPADAEKLVNEGVAVASSHLSPDAPGLLFAKAALGRVMIESGSYDKAIEILSPIANRKPVGEEETYAVRDSLSDLCVGELYASQLDTAESMCRRAISLDRQMLGQSHPQTGVDLMNLASVQTTEGQYSEAEKTYRSALEIIKNWYGADHPDYVTSMSIFARTLMVEGKFDEAETVLKQVLSVQEKNYGQVHDRIAFTLDTLGKIAVKRNDLALAESEFARAVSINRTLLGNNNYQTALVESDLGDAYTRESKYTLAETTLRESVQPLEALPPGNPYIGLAQARLGRCLLLLKRYKDAEVQLTLADRSMEKMKKQPEAQRHEVRQNLILVYRALNQPQDARRIEAELNTSISATAPAVLLK